jgi:hypothetical protein
MRMIVDAFKDTLELGLEKPKQVVVRFPYALVSVPPNPDQNGGGSGLILLHETWNPSLLCGH